MRLSLKKNHNLAPTLFASPSIFRVPITLVFIVCKVITPLRLVCMWSTRQVVRKAMRLSKLYLHWIVFVENRRGRACKMVDLINLNQQRLRDIYQCIKFIISINIICLQKWFSNAEHSNAESASDSNPTHSTNWLFKKQLKNNDFFNSWCNNFEAYAQCTP